MKTIDMAQWPRKAQYELYRDFDFPYLNVTAAVEVGGFMAQAKEAGSTFTIALIYLLSKAANEQPAFRTRIRPEQVVVHDTVHPSITVLAESDRLGFCTIPFGDRFERFQQQAQGLIENARRQPSLQDPPGKDDMLFMTSIPWVAFSALTHPVPLNPPDSVPRIAWGRVTEAAGIASMPLSVQCNHAIMDGVHLGRYFERVQALLVEPFSGIDR